MKILIDLYQTQHGGGLQFILNQLSSLLQIDQENQYYIIVSSKGVCEHIDSHPRVNTFLLKRSMYNYAIGINKVIREKRIDIVYSPNSIINPFIFHKSILVVQNVKNYPIDYKYNNLYERYKYLILQILTKKSERISLKNIYVSEYIKSLSYRNFQQKAIIIYHGIDTTKQKKPSKQNYVFTVSAADMSHKNIGLIKEACRAMNLPVKIAGKYENSENYEEYCGYVVGDELIELYRNAKMYISASTHESFGMTPMEAMRCGTPCIITDIPVYKEVYGEAALYFKPNDTEGLIKQIKRLMNDNELYMEMVNRGYEQIKKFSWEENAQELLKVFEEVAYPHKRRSS